jgi:hypothetical protein
MNVKRALSDFRAPDETAAEDRAWEAVRSARLDRLPTSPRRPRWRLAIGPAVMILAGALALSPAGASVRRWIRDQLGVRHAAPALFSLPAPGRVLVSGPGGTWIVRADGSARRLGTWPEASWSPHGLFVAVAGASQLAAVDPDGIPRWTLARPAVTDPRWYYPTGYRIAYLSGTELRVVAGDGAGDRLLAAGVAPVPPAWRPGHPYQLAYLTDRGELVVRDADNGRLIWSSHVAGARALTWSPGGRQLLVLGRARALVFDAAGRSMAKLSLPPRTPILGGALSPNGRTLALVRGGDADDVVLANLDSRGAALRRVFSGAGLRQLAWSPDGRWLLVTWPAADQWVFVRVAGSPRIAAVSRIAQQFAIGASPRGFPRLEGWCCTRSGAAG